VRIGLPPARECTTGDGGDDQPPARICCRSCCASGFLVVPKQLPDHLRSFLATSGLQIDPAHRHIAHFEPRVDGQEFLQHTHSLVASPRATSTRACRLARVGASVHRLLKVGLRAIDVPLTAEEDTEVVQARESRVARVTNSFAVNGSAASRTDERSSSSRGSGWKAAIIDAGRKSEVAAPPPFEQ